MKMIYCSLILLFFSGCFPFANEPAFVVRNESDVTFQTMTLTTNQKVVTYYNVYPGYCAKGKLTFNKSNRMDGGYGIQLFNNDTLVRHEGWGYYTNGASMDKNCDITILPDTIIIKENTGL